MSILGILGLLLQLAEALASYGRDKQLMEAGAAEAALKGLKDAREATKRALAARAAVRDDPVSVRDDPDNIDGRPKR